MRKRVGGKKKGEQKKKGGKSTGEENIEQWKKGWKGKLENEKGEGKFEKGKIWKVNIEKEK